MARARACVVGVVAIALGASLAGAGGVTVTPQEELEWTPAGVPGVSTAVVDGDLTRGPARFYLEYAAGLVTPEHHHSADHYVTTVSGTLVLKADGKERRLAPGSYFAFVGKAPHVAKCEGSEACVMFVEARGPWDVVLETAAKP